MSADPNDALRAPQVTVAPLVARAAAADRRADRRLQTAIEDFFLAENDRLDDRTRAAIGTLLTDAIGAIAGEIVGHAARQLSGQWPRPEAAGLVSRLSASGLLRDAGLMSELLGQTRQDLLADALRGNRAPGAQPVLLAQLAGCGDGVIAAAARLYIRAENRRRTVGGARGSDFPAHLHRQLIWWTAAAVREQLIAAGGPLDRLDRALVAGAQRSIAAHDDDDRLDAIALRLAAAIDARPEELADLLAGALDEGYPALFSAILAHALGIDFGEARTLVLDPVGDVLWFALRAHHADRAAIARVGLALADADPRRDIEAFADNLDAIAAITPDDARVVLGTLSLPADFRAAVRALGRTGA